MSANVTLPGDAGAVESALLAFDALRRNPGTVAVMGSLNADYSVRCDRLPQPGETVEGEGLTIAAGGKSSNQAACAARLGADVRMVGAVGDDSSGRFLLDALGATGVDVSGVETLDCPTGTAVIEVDSHAENSIVVSPGANGRVDAGFVRDHMGALEGRSVLGLCLEVPMDGVVEAARWAHERGMRVLLNNSPFVPELPRGLVECSDVLLVNEHELAQMLGMSEPDDGDWSSVSWQAISAALGELGFYEAVVTLGGDGAMVLGGTEAHHVEPVRVHAVDTTGCGDAFMGAVLAGLAAGLGLAQAADMAAHVGAYAATGHGAQASYGTVAQIREAFGE